MDCHNLYNCISWCTACGKQSTCTMNDRFDVNLLVLVGLSVLGKTNTISERWMKRFMTQSGWFLSWLHTVLYIKPSFLCSVELKNNNTDFTARTVYSLVHSSEGMAESGCFCCSRLKINYRMWQIEGIRQTSPCLTSGLISFLILSKNHQTQ